MLDLKENEYLTFMCFLTNAHEDDAILSIREEISGEQINEDDTTECIPYDIYDQLDTTMEEFEENFISSKEIKCGIELFTKVNNENKKYVIEAIKYVDCEIFK